MTKREKLIGGVAVGLLVLGGRPAVKKATAPAAAPASGLQLETGRNYQARIELSGIEAMLGTSNAVRDKLVGAGFRDVIIQDLGGGKFIAHGIWNRAPTVAKLPSQVKEVHAA